MKTLCTVPYRSIAHKFFACLLAFFIVNLPVWALSGSNATIITGASQNPGGPNLVSFMINGRGIIEWSQMNANQFETLQFTGGTDFAVLNRVLSAIDFDGFLDATSGHVLFVSPNGIVIGPNARISAKSFIASGLDISNTNFLAGNYQFIPFEIEGAKVIGTVTNKGKIGFNEDGTSNPVKYAALIGSQVLNKGTILADEGLVVLASGDEIFLGSEGSDVLVSITPSDIPVANDTYNVINDVAGRIENPGGTIVLAAGDTYAQAIAGLQNTAYTVNTYTASQRGVLESQTLEIGAANQADIRTASITAANEIKIAAKKVLLEETVQSGGTMIIDADFDINALKGLESGDTMKLSARTVQVRENITSDSTTTINADFLYSCGDITSEDNLLLMTEAVLWSEADQTIRSNTSVKSTGAISKITRGNLYISAAENVQLDGDVAAVDGGVSVIAETGKIHTGDGTDTLNIAISGYSDEITDSIGVDLPDGEGKAAIVLKSHDTLNLGPEAELKADGFYLSANDDPDNGVDNRPDITWLDTDATEIGGHERDEGIASDVAIYVGSETGDVNVETTQIETAQPSDQGDIASGPATVVFDAYDTVTMPSLENIQQNRQEQENDNLFRFRLEVASRITEWLFQAIQNGTLPYANDPEAVEAVLGEDYVLRGAGLDNPQITDGRAWVLENPPITPPEESPEPPIAPIAPLAEYELPDLVGCPVEMEAAAVELDINPDDLQLLIQDSMATNPNLQPCQACARLLVAAGALRDEDGARLAAMNEIFNILAPAEAPFTQEIAASIATAFSNLADREPQYALAGDYIDSFVDYVAVLNQDLKTPIGDAVVYTLNKYGEAVISNPNQNIVSYLVEQVQDRG